jgi:hypothetical protein
MVDYISTNKRKKIMLKKNRYLSNHNFTLISDER